MPLLSEIIKKELTSYRQSDILWKIVSNDKVKVRIPYYDVDKNELDLGQIHDSDTLPIVTLEMSETMSEAKRKDVTSKQMYFYENSMYNFCRDYGDSSYSLNA